VYFHAIAIGISEKEVNSSLVYQCSRLLNPIISDSAMVPFPLPKLTMKTKPWGFCVLGKRRREKEETALTASS
jgi:hypothetical protein